MKIHVVTITVFFLEGVHDDAFPYFYDFLPYDVLVSSFHELQLW